MFSLRLAYAYLQHCTGRFRVDRLSLKMTLGSHGPILILLKLMAEEPFSLNWTLAQVLTYVLLLNYISNIISILHSYTLFIFINIGLGCGFASKKQYLFGRVSMKIKLIPGDSAGTVAAFYVIIYTNISSLCYCISKRFGYNIKLICADEFRYQFCTRRA